MRQRSKRNGKNQLKFSRDRKKTKTSAFLWISASECDGVRSVYLSFNLISNFHMLQSNVFLFFSVVFISFGCCLQCVPKKRAKNLWNGIYTRARDSRSMPPKTNKQQYQRICEALVAAYAMLAFSCCYFSQFFEHNSKTGNIITSYCSLVAIIFKKNWCSCIFFSFNFNSETAFSAVCLC